jgi:HEAT repeat protein
VQRGDGVGAGEEDEGPRLVVAECLGRLAAVAPGLALPKIAGLAQSGDAGRRFVAAVALRGSLVPSNAEAFADTAPVVLPLLSDDDLSVRREAVVTVAHFAKQDVSVIEPHLEETIVPALLEAVTFEDKHVEVIDFGHFTDRRDHKKPTRISAYEALGRVLAEAGHHVNVAGVVGKVGEGVSEREVDVQLAAYRLLSVLADEQPAKLLESLDTVVPKITGGIKPRFKEAQAGDARAQQTLRALVVAVLKVSALPGVQQCTAFCKFKRQVMVTRQLRAIVDELEGKDGGK